MICDTNKCTGCFACYNICPVQAIRMVENNQGFLYPEIDSQVCVHCGKCERVCPSVNFPNQNKNISVYAALVKNDKERAKSTSGGVFGCLSQNILKKGGSIYGAEIDNNMTIRHIEVNCFEDLDKIRGSKYVQSEIGDCYKQAEKHLKEGKKVLFSGTPCQIAGLKNYLGQEYDNLLTVDILCHGVPSPRIFRKYIESEEQRAGTTIKEMQFRSKRIGWKKNFSVRTFENGIEADWPDTFVPGFLKNYYLRESCYQCNYATQDRQGDITLGDYWGYHESAPEYIEDDDRGISLVLINTEKGQMAISKIHKKLAMTTRTIEDAKRKNQVLYQPCQKPDDYCTFWNMEAAKEWPKLCEQFIPEQDTNEWMSAEDRAYFAMPYRIRHMRHLMHIYKHKLSKIIKQYI